MAEIIRAQLAQPEQDLVSEDTFNQLFTMHGTIMLLLFVSPFAIGLANYLVPLQIGARDVAFPRLNALGYWLTLFAGIVMMGGFATANGAAKFGWYAYSPLTSDVRTPGLGGDLWIMGIALLGASGVITGVNMVATISTMRAPGMTFFRMPIFTWNFFVTSLLILMTFPVLTAAGAMLFLDRHFNFHVFDAAFGGVPVLWQHLFWWFGHPEVYILILPFFGVFTEIFPVFSRRPVFGYKGLCFATLAIGFLSLGVWAHHMFTTGVVVLSFFSVSTMLIAVPTGVKFFNWIATMWGGKLRLPHADGVGDRVPADVPPRRAHRADAGLTAARLPPQRLVLRGGPLPLRALRRLGVRHLRRGLLLVPEVHRPHARTSGSGWCTSCSPSSGCTSRSSSSTSSGSRACRAASRATSRRTGSAHSTSCRRSAPSSSASRCCRSSGTCGGR